VRWKVMLAIGGVAAVSIGAALPAFETPTVHANRTLPPGLTIASGGPAFTALDGPALVPADVLEALPALGQATLVAWANIDQGRGAFDRAVLYRTSVPASTVFAFYQAAFARRGWTLLSTGRAVGGGHEVLAERAGSDGAYWEAGALIRRGETVVAPDGAAVRDATGEAQSGPGTGSNIELRLYQVPDPD